MDCMGSEALYGTLKNSVESQKNIELTIVLRMVGPHIISKGFCEKVALSEE